MYADVPIPASPDVTAGGPVHVAALLREVQQTVTRHYPAMFPVGLGDAGGLRGPLPA